MQRPVNITYRGVEKSEEIDQFILEKAARLEKFCDHINRCDVAIEQPNHAHHKGNQFRVRIDVTVPPGHELVADEKQMDSGAHAALTKVIHDAFKTMERQLRHLVQKQRRE
jgi:ribosomal subunit interface protein